MKSISLKIKTKDISEDSYQIEEIGVKNIYNTDGKKSASSWIKEEIKNKTTIDLPQVSSAISVKHNEVNSSKLIDSSVGCFVNQSNYVQYNPINVVLLSSSNSSTWGYSIISKNFRKVVALFTARKSVASTWINCKDEYLVPNTEHPDYEQWNNDCIIYSLFNNSSQQSSLRNIDYKDKKWNIINNFFFMSNKEMRELANSHNYKEMYQDTKAFDKDRYVYNLLSELTVSSDAKKVLDMAITLIKKSVEDREDYNDEFPKYQLSSWDASWAQLKPLLKAMYKEEYAEFVKAYKEFENRMREGVYKFGFLKE